MAETNEQTYDYVCFGDLAYEFDFSDFKEAEKKIKRKLKYHGLGKYDQDRVEYVRRLKTTYSKRLDFMTSQDIIFNQNPNLQNSQTLTMKK